MSNERLFFYGRKIKNISYISNNNFIRAVCKLKEDIDFFRLSEFFNKIYRLRLDSLYFNCFEDNYCTADLVRCFYLILNEDNLIDLKKLYFFIDDSSKKNIFPILIIIREFFDMFEFVEQEIVSLDDIVFLQNNVSFDELDSITYNSKVFECISSKKLLELRKRVC